MRTARAWTDLVSKVKAFYSARGAILNRIVMHPDRQADFILACLGQHGTDLEIGETSKSPEVCLGVNITFHPKVSEPTMALFVSESDDRI